MARQLAGTLIAAALCFYTGAALPAAAFKIATASERGTYFVIGKDLAKLVAPDADIELEVMPTSGSAINIKLLRFEPGVKLAIVQADVYQASSREVEAQTPTRAE